MDGTFFFQVVGIAHENTKRDKFKLSIEQHGELESLEF